jgi:nicotinic acid phosphoribosyltransferase
MYKLASMEGIKGHDIGPNPGENQVYSTKMLNHLQTSTYMYIHYIDCQDFIQPTQSSAIQSIVFLIGV